MTFKNNNRTDALGNLEKVLSDLKTVSNEIGRDPQSVSVVAVSKTHHADTNRPVLEAGQRIFGENRVQEASQRWQGRKSVYPDLELHLIGPLQSNKAADAVSLFDVFHTVDRPKIALALSREMASAQRTLPCFIQVKTGEEEQKAGI